jgi:hypothetical protein
LAGEIGGAAARGGAAAGNALEQGWNALTGSDLLSEPRSEFVFNAPQVNPNAFHFGGRPGAAQEYAGSAFGYGDEYGAQLPGIMERTSPGLMGQERQQSREMGYGALGGMGQTAGQMGTQADYLRQVSLGQAGPSVAEGLLQQGLDRATRQQMAAAASGPGWNPGAQAAAAQVGGQMRMEGIQQAAQLRAQEIAQARDQYGATLGQQGGLYGAQAQGALGMQGAEAAWADAVRSGQFTQQELNQAYWDSVAGQRAGMYELGLRPLELEQQGAMGYQQMQTDIGLAGERMRAEAMAANAAAASRERAMQRGLIGGAFERLEGLVTDDDDDEQQQG